MSQPDAAPPLAAGTVILDRYEVEAILAEGRSGTVFQAFDRVAQQRVALEVVRRRPDDDEMLRQELLCAQTVRHPNVCRMLALTPSPWGTVIVMELIPGPSLHAHIREQMARGGFSVGELRRIASAICAGVAAIHETGLTHGDVNPHHVVVGEARVALLGFDYARGANASIDPPRTSTPSYMSPERLRLGGSSAEDDVYALALTLWEMLTGRVPEPGEAPRAQPMRAQIAGDLPPGLSLGELEQLFRALHEDPMMRPQARNMRFCDPAEVSLDQRPRLRLATGQPPGRDDTRAFTPSSQSLLVTHAPGAPALVGTLLPLEQPVLSLGAGADQDVVLAEPTVSAAHAVLRWQEGAWLVEDRGSAHGTYAGDGELAAPLTIVHGDEVQVGDCRLALVSFGPDSIGHRRARQFLHRHDGLTGLLRREALSKALEEEQRFRDWAGAPMTLARYALRGRAQPTNVELLALRRVARRIVELTETRLPSTLPVVAGRTGPLELVVSMVGPTFDEARDLVEEIVAQVQATSPIALDHWLEEAAIAAEREHV